MVFLNKTNNKIRWFAAIEDRIIDIQRNLLFFLPHKRFNIRFIEWESDIWCSLDLHGCISLSSVLCSLLLIIFLSRAFPWLLDPADIL